MKPFPWQAILATAALLAATPDLQAQRASQDPHIGYIYPAGGQQGTTVEVTLGGQFIKETNEIFIAGGGVTAKIVKHYRPLTQGEYTQLNMKLSEVREKMEEEQAKQGKSGPIPLEVLAKAAGITEEQLKEIEVYRKRQDDPKRQPNDQIIEELTLEITVAHDAKPGKREMRVTTPDSMSNPLWFHVGQWRECRETEPNDTKPDPVIGYILPTVVNGQIMPGDRDRFSFTARKGNRLVINAAVRDVMPYLADAVPGWFQGVLILYNARGDELVYAGAFHYRQDPVIYYEVPEDGQYTVEIRDSIHRGREDFVYRITIGELPFVTGIFPLGGRAGTDVSVELQGWNLTQTKLDVRAVVNRNRPVRWYSIPQTDKVSIDFPLRLDMTSEVLDQEPNNDRETAQEVTLPIIVNGRIDKPDDVDLFRFNAHGTLVAEVLARRAGSPVDSALTLVDAEGKEIGFNDDYEDKAQPLITHHADSRLVVTLSGKSPFTLRLSDAQRKGGNDFIYRLYIRPPRPDFDLRIVPCTIIARPGTVVPITAHVLRRDDFNDDVVLSLVEPPDGFKLDGAVVPGSADKVRLTLTVPPTASPEPFTLEMDGQSLGGHGQRLRLSRPAVPAENMMQAFIWYHLVPAEQWTVIVNGKAGAKMPLAFPPVEQVKLKLGEKTTLSAMVTEKNTQVAQLRVELSEPPPGISVEKVSPEGKALAVVLAVDAEKVKAGFRGNLLFRVYREWTPAPTETNLNPKPQQSSYGFLPAMPFEVIGRAPRK